MFPQYYIRSDICISGIELYYIMMKKGLILCYKKCKLESVLFSFVK